MTERLYQNDPRLTEFTARLLKQEPGPSGFRVILDRTSFYPEGGGQPADHGWLDGTPVLDVQVEGEEVVHIVPSSLSSSPGEEVRGRIDEERRFDFMQQHTGQHILSASLLLAAGLKTVSSHLGEESTTIELEAEAVPEAKLLECEDLANSVISRNLPVRVRWVTAQEVKGLSLRRPPPARERLRLVEIEDFDLCACGGTHCASSGEVGLVRCSLSERIRGRVRLHWKIGRRAFQDFRAKDRLAAALGQELSCPPEGILEGVRALKARLAEEIHGREKLAGRLAKTLAAALHESSPRAGKATLVLQSFQGEEPAMLRELLDSLLERKATAALLLNLSEAELQWMAGVSEDLDPVLEELFRPLLPLIEGRGGGRGRRFQGGGRRPAGSKDFLQAMEEALRRRLEGKKT